MLARNEDYVDLSRPSIEGLIYALRHKEVWPDNFDWYFPDCNSCAIGLCHALWPRHIGKYPTSFDVLSALGIAKKSSRPSMQGVADDWTDSLITSWRAPFLNGNHSTQPEHVAASLEIRLQLKSPCLT